MTLSPAFGVDLNRWGYIGRQSTYVHTAETSRPGVFVAGSATGPETIDDSIAQGHAPAMAAMGMAMARVTEAAE